MDIYGNSALEKTLLNPLILEKIFVHLDFTTLKKSVRPPRHCVWADVGAAFVGEKGYLIFSRFRGMTIFNPILARNVHLYLDPKCDCVQNCICQTYLKPVVTKISNILTELHLWVGSEYGLIPKEPWRTCNVRNRLSIFVKSWRSEVALRAKQFRPLANLRVIRINLIGRGDQNHTIVGLTTTLQGLIKSANQLEELHIFTTGNLVLLPDSASLKILKFSGSIQFPSTFAISGMLDKFVSGLEQLEIGFSGLKGFELVQTLNFSAPNLTHLTIHHPSLYIMEDFLDVTHLPKLTHLSIRGGRISEIFKTRQPRHEGIMSLELDTSTYWNLQNVEAASKIVYLFPSVTEFKMKLKLPIAPHTVSDYTHFVETIGSFGAWELTRGEVVIEGACSRIFASLLERLVEWRGLKNTSLRFNESTEQGEFKFTDRMDEQTRNDLKELITERNLPVSL